MDHISTPVLLIFPLLSNTRIYRQRDTYLPLKRAA